MIKSSHLLHRKIEEFRPHGNFRGDWRFDLQRPISPNCILAVPVLDFKVRIVYDDMSAGSYNLGTSSVARRQSYTKAAIVLRISLLKVYSVFVPLSSLEHPMRSVN